MDRTVNLKKYLHTFFDQIIRKIDSKEKINQINLDQDIEFFKKSIEDYNNELEEWYDDEMKMQKEQFLENLLLHEKNFKELKKNDYFAGKLDNQ